MIGDLIYDMGTLLYDVHTPRKLKKEGGGEAMNMPSAPMLRMMELEDLPFGRLGVTGTTLVWLFS